MHIIESLAVQARRQDLIAELTKAVDCLDRKSETVSNLDDLLDFVDELRPLINRAIAEIERLSEAR